MFTESELLVLIDCVNCYRGEAGQDKIEVNGEIVDLRNVLIKIKATGKDYIKIKGKADRSIEDCD